MLQNEVDRNPQLQIVCFNGHPPLGVNATREVAAAALGRLRFQRAPTLGGECYGIVYADDVEEIEKFQRAPTLGGECYHSFFTVRVAKQDKVSTGTHPWG